MKPRPATGNLDTDFTCIQRGGRDSLGEFELACPRPCLGLADKQALVSALLPCSNPLPTMRRGSRAFSWLRGAEAIPRTIFAHYLGVRAFFEKRCPKTPFQCCLVNGRKIN